MLYRRLLQGRGSDVVDAVDGRDALARALSVRPSLVLTELRLPILDGFALCSVLRRDSQTKDGADCRRDGGEPPLGIGARARGRRRRRPAETGDAEALLREIDRLLEQPPPATESREPKATRSASPRRSLKMSSRWPISGDHHDAVDSTARSVVPAV
jgi:CheY-like chemotaxis protein